MVFLQDYLDFILDQLAGFSEITHKKMFGGIGIYKDGLMFSGIKRGILHLNVNDETHPVEEVKIDGIHPSPLTPVSMP